MTGPAGTAKTTTIRVLAREMGFEILEWRDAVGERHFDDSGEHSYRYTAILLPDFLTYK
jgi:hypothetical protein